MNNLEKNIFNIGDIVYILGKYMPNSYEPTYIIEVKISHIEHRQFVAYETNGPCCWKFSNKHYNKSVFKNKENAIEKLNIYGKEKEKKYG